MNSDYCYSVELTRALERHKSGEARVLPIILRPVHWQDVLGKIQALPKDGKPVIGPDWYSIDNALFNVAEGIIKAVKAVEDIQKKATQNIPPPQNPLQDAPQSMASQQFIPPYPIPPPTQGNANRQVNVNQRRRRFLIVVGTMIGLVLTAFGVLVFMLSAYDTTHYVYYITEFVVGTIFIGIGAVIFCKSAVAMIGRYTAIFSIIPDITLSIYEFLYKVMSFCWMFSINTTWRNLFLMHTHPKMVMPYPRCKSSYWDVEREGN